MDLTESDAGIQQRLVYSVHFMDSMCQRTMLGVGAKQLAGASCRLILIYQYIIIG